ncbi:hypothetical protein M569_16540 [Genlisea aurea]|uniref:Cytochrome P450 n=1 Tax=Genlisea aurea TaxID=192259 RepID=S8BUK4_9LAMI|nr:hypothetical protein M569_16540 [Genlisea aurea]
MAFFPDHIILTCTAVIFLFLFLFRRRRPRRKLPPSPSRLPIIGNFHQLGPLPHRAFQTLSKKYGPLMLLHLGSVPTIIVSSAGAAREVLKHQDAVFCSRPYSSVTNKAFYGGRDVALSPYGEYWRRNRSVCVLHLLTAKRVRSFHGIMDEETSNMIGEIRGSSSRAVNFQQMVRSMMMDVICRVTLGKKTSPKLNELMTDLSGILGKFNVEIFMPWLGWINRFNGFNSRLGRVVTGLDEILSGLLRERRDNKEEEASNFIDILLELQSENNAAFEDESIKAIILVQFFSKNFLVWILYRN